MSGGGGGANNTNASGPPGIDLRSFGGAGAIPLLTSADINPNAASFSTYGAGGGGSESNGTAQQSYKNQSVEREFVPQPNSSAGQGGIARGPATGGVAGSGSGCGGGAFE